MIHPQNSETSTPTCLICRQVLLLTYLSKITETDGRRHTNVWRTQNAKQSTRMVLRKDSPVCLRWVTVQLRTDNEWHSVQEKNNMAEFRSRVWNFKMVSGQ